MLKASFDRSRSLLYVFVVFVVNVSFVVAFSFAVVFGLVVGVRYILGHLSRSALNSSYLLFSRSLLMSCGWRHFRGWVSLWSGLVS